MHCVNDLYSISSDIADVMFLSRSSQQKTIINAAAVNEEGVLATAGECYHTPSTLLLLCLLPS